MHAAEERKLAHEAKDLSKRVGSPPLRKFTKWLNQKYVNNTFIVSKDARIAVAIHEKEVFRLRISSVRSKSKSV